VGAIVLYVAVLRKKLEGVKRLVEGRLGRFPLGSFCFRVQQESSRKTEWSCDVIRERRGVPSSGSVS
jgi:hypothetical protein